MAYCNNVKTNVPTKFSTGSSTTICIFLMMATMTFKFNCQEWKLNLNVNKYEVFPFSTWSNDITWNPTIFTGTQKVCVSTTYRLLSVILDRSLTFNEYLKKLTASLTSTICIIRATAHTSWGWHRSALKMAFHALIHSKLDYAASALALRY